MKKLSFNKAFKKPGEALRIQNSRDQLIADIVNETNEKSKKAFARLIALQANALGWTDSDLHALLAKRNDPKIRNFTAFVKWSIKTRETKPRLNSVTH